MTDKGQTESDKQLNMAASDPLTESERKYQTLFANNVSGVFFQRADGQLIEANDRALDLLGLTLDQFLGRTSMHPDWRVLNDNGEEMLWEEHPSMVALRTGQPVRNVRLAVYNPMRQGFVWLKVDAVPEFKNGEPTPFETFVTITDVTEQRQAELALKESEQKYRSLFQNMINGFALHEIVLDDRGMPVDYIFLEANESFEKITGLKRNAIIGKKVTDVLPGIEKDPANWIGRYGEVALTGKMIQFDQEAAPMEQWFSVSAYSPNKGQFATIFEDISERKKTETILKQSEDKFHTLVKASPYGITLSTLDDLRFVEVNDAFCDMTGYSRQEILYSTSLLEPLFGTNETDENTILDQLKDATRPVTGEYSFVCKNGKRVDTTFTSRIVHLNQTPHIFSCFSDVTETRRLEAQLRQSQKMESVGRLAGGVAHDFNNMLGVIIGHSELALDSLTPIDPVYSSLMEIQKAADRSAQLTRQLLTFARKQAVVPKTLDLNTEISGMMGMLKRLIGEHIELNWEPAKDSCVVKIDPAQVGQILTNLTINARDAIDGRGAISIHTEKTFSNHTIPCIDGEGAPGDYVRLTVSDTGHGMNSETLKHVFDPFYTTKDVGEGTGLGLSTIYGIVRQNGGFIDATSAPDKGTAFSIYLPADNTPTDVAPIEEATGSDTIQRETILLVEDEESVLNMTRLMLENLGYHVISTNRPKDALTLAAAHDGTVHLIVTDVIMPEMNGRELVKKLADICPHAQHLYVSGYTADVLSPRGVVPEEVHFIQKPYTKKILGQKIQQVLSASTNQ
ncbi:MAG: PAS domain S-box protein [Deltaproteobacteria bacterium]|nr:PAS domain S-box protein [Deltaproteobacteria bacterium]